MEREVVILDIDYVTNEEDKPVLRLFSKDHDKNVVLLDDSFEPYLYVLPRDDIEQTKKEILDEVEVVRVENITKKDFQIEKDALKVFLKHPQEVSKKRELIRLLDSVQSVREADIPFYRRYLMDNDIIPMTKVRAVGEKMDSFLDLEGDDLEIIKLTEPLLRIQEDVHDFRILTFDLEVRNPRGMPNADVDEIIMIGVSSNFGINKVISTKTKTEGDASFIEQVSSEKEMIETFVRLVKKSNVDIIIGYNSDNFDFPYLVKRAKILDVPLSIGMDGSEVKFVRRGGYTDSASIKGLVHVDLYLVMRRYITLERYTLERVYYELFGEEKIDVPGDRIWEFWDGNGPELDRLFDYSLDDVVATLKIAEQTLPLNLELTHIVGQPLFDLSRMSTGQQAEWYLVKEAHFDDELVPNKNTGANTTARLADDNEGGYVKEPEKGLHENLVQFDFRSLYPSLIISKNISPDVLEIGEVSNPEDYNISPEHDLKFKKEPKGFIPSVIGKILTRRLAIKKLMKASDDETEKKVLNVEQQALKRLLNTMYGIYGFPSFRWYSFECAKAITSWGRQYIKMSMEKAEEFGFYTIYADTDGFYVKYKK